MNKLQLFSNPEFGSIRCITYNNEAWFIGKDVSKVLGYTNPNESVQDNVDIEDRKFFSYKQLKEGNSLQLIVTDKQQLKEFYSGINIINESGIYSLVFGSSLPTAKKFKHWVTSEVLPSIRKNGGYIANQEILTPEQIVANALVVAQNIISSQKLELEQAKPKVEFFDAVADSRDAVSIGEVAKVLAIKGIGRNNMFELLRNKKVLMKDNMPFQVYIDRGYFRVIEQKYMKDNEVCISFKTLVYQKGLDFIRKVVTE